ncbi:MAG TPA: hypothetical protein VNV62_00470 [Trebonia sp.]|jgi:hypothetical protein|nr:hypothetical protein [Trebonia sp.]
MHRDRLNPPGGHYPPGFIPVHARPPRRRRARRAALMAAARAAAALLWLPGHAYLRAAGAAR